MDNQILLLFKEQELKYCKMFLTNKDLFIPKEERKKIILDAAKLMKTDITEIK